MNFGFNLITQFQRYFSFGFDGVGVEFACLFIFSDLANICRLCCKHFPSVFPVLSSAMIQLGDGLVD